MTESAARFIRFAGAPPGPDGSERDHRDQTGDGVKDCAPFAFEAVAEAVENGQRGIAKAIMLEFARALFIIPGHVSSSRKNA